MARVEAKANQQGWHPEVTLLGAAGYDNTLFTIAGSNAAVEGAYLYLPTAMYLGEDRADIPEVDLFLTWMQKTNPGANIDLFTVYGWVSAELFVQALQAAGPQATRAEPARRAATDRQVRRERTPRAGGPASKTTADLLHHGADPRRQVPAPRRPPGAYRCDGTYVYRHGVDVFLQFTVVGLTVGCIYALTATGLTVTYITSGIFNFAHGAVGMIAAFTYWELTVEARLAAAPAALAVLFILAPIMGLLIEQLMRRLHGAPTEVTLVITLGLLLALIGVAQTRWDPGVARVLPEFFAGEPGQVFGVNVTYHELIVVLTTIAVVIGLRLFLYRTRAGIALRAVVDAPDVAALNGAAPDRVSQMGWVIGAMLASLAGVLLAPVLGAVDIILLTLLVINGYAAAIVGRLRSLPLTFGGGLALGLIESYAIEFSPQSLVSDLHVALPILFLFVMLLLVPEARLSVGRTRHPAAPAHRRACATRSSPAVAFVGVRMGRVRLPVEPGPVARWAAAWSSRSSCCRSCCSPATAARSRCASSRSSASARSRWARSPAATRSSACSPPSGCRRSSVRSSRSRHCGCAACTSR